MKTNRKSQIAAWRVVWTFALMGTIIGSLVWLSPRPTDGYSQTVAQYEAGDRAEAKHALETYVQSNSRSPKTSTQDRVTESRLRLGYLAAQSRNFDKAHAQFVQAAVEHKGSQEATSEFGGLVDQALYQAAVCLAASGKKAEAVEAFRAFLKDQSQSPLVHAAFRRLATLHGGQATASEEQLLQSAVTKQETQAKLELAQCGPKAMAFFLERLGKGKRDYHQLGDLAGTDSGGTSLLGARQALQSVGVQVIGLELNRKDFNRLKTPALWLLDDHFLVLTDIYAHQVDVYDPLTSTKRTIKLPSYEDPNFMATVLALESPITEGNS